jgi:hypothetical protein
MAFGYDDAAMLLFSLFAGMGGGGSSSTPTQASDPETAALLKKILGLQAGQAERVDPLQQDIVTMARNLLPQKLTRPGGYSGTMPTGAAPSRTTFSGSAAPPTNINSRDLNNVMTYIANQGGSAASDPFRDSSLINVGGNAYGIPGSSSRPLTGPEDPDPMHHPLGANAGAGRDVSEYLKRWLGGNPANAFFGSGMTGGGEQTWNGGRGRAV